ncbi:aldehyde dehydrogenase [Lentzea sp. NBRC 105346]|nr:aldehyde dehydrogenase [Lentzea sp. NBRC 105346]
MEEIALIRPSGDRMSRDVSTLTAVDGSALASVSQAPPLLVSLTLRSLSAGAVSASVLADAGKLFASATLCGETPDAYVRNVAAATGLPLSVVDSALPTFASVLPRMEEMVDAARPWGSPSSRWVRRGRTLGVVAPSNHPMVHIEWLQALFLGYALLVRPGGRDPFTPRRLAWALFEAGLPRTQLAVLPGPHASGATLLAEADLGLVYGSASAVAPYVGSSRVAVRGPGRAKALVLGSDVSWVLEQIAGDGGVRCNNVSTVFCSGAPESLASSLASRLAAVPNSALPVHSSDAAKALRGLLGDARLVGDEPLVELGDGQAVLRPAVALAARPGPELPFPCVWVVPWEPASGIAPLRDSLAVLLPADVPGDLLAEALDEPSIRAVVCGDRGEWWADPLLPHDGYLAHFLMECRGVVGCPPGF